EDPQIDLRLDSYETSTRNFLTAVSNYTQRAVSEISNRKAAYAAEKKRIAEKTQQIETEISQSKLKEIELIAVLDKEQEEKKESEASVAAFRRQLNSIKEKCASFDVEIEQHSTVAANLLRGTSFLPYIHLFSTPWRPIAACNLSTPSCARFYPSLRFRHHRISSFLDVSERAYKVPTTTPFPTLPILLDELNESRDIYAFVRRVRHAFHELAIDGR
ncbi:hypothetical protein C8Q78DRAFT_974398, partial [Trametes maxima]